MILGRRARQARMRWSPAWLPGTEGEGVADVLFGDYKPTGKLSFYVAAVDGADADQQEHRAAIRCSSTASD